RSSERAYQSIKTRGVIEMTVAEHDGLDVLGRVVKHPHILKNPIRCHASIEEHLMLSSMLRERHQRREAMLCQNRCESVLSFHESSRNTRHPWTKHWPLRRSLIGKQTIKQVISKDAHRDCINWL